MMNRAEKSYVGGNAEVGCEPEAPTLGQLCARWTTVFVFLFTFGTWLFMFALLDDSPTGIGVGVFCAFWGAPGFGLMVAGAQWWKRTEVEYIGARTRSNSIIPPPREGHRAAGVPRPEVEDAAVAPTPELAFT